MRLVSGDPVRPLARDARGQWQPLAVDPEELGATSFLAAREARSVQELRLIVTPKRGVVPAIERLRLLGLLVRPMQINPPW